MFIKHNTAQIFNMYRALCTDGYGKKIFVTKFWLACTLFEGESFKKEKFFKLGEASSFTMWAVVIVGRRIFIEALAVLS